MDPTAETYQVMMRHHMREGDLEAVRACMDEAEADRVVLYPRHFLELATSIAQAGKSQLMAEASRLHENSNFYLRPAASQI